MNKRIRVGFIGYGYFAKLRHEILAKRKDVFISGFFDPYKKSVKKIKKFKKIDDFLLSNDLVFIATPPKFAPYYVKLCLKKNIATFCEKPAAINTEELIRIKKFIKPNSLLAYGFNHRLQDSIIYIKKILSNKKLGKILWLRGRYGKEVNKSFKKNWRCKPELSGGGILIDQGIHLLDIIDYLSGGLNNCNSVLSNFYLKTKKIDDNAFITLYSKVRKISASLHSTLTQWRYLFSLEVFCEFGSIILNGLKTNSDNYGDEILTIHSRSGNPSKFKSKQLQFKKHRSIQLEINAFIKSFKQKKKYPYANYSNAIRITKLVDKIYKKGIWL